MRSVCLLVPSHVTLTYFLASRELLTPLSIVALLARLLPSPQLYPPVCVCYSGFHGRFVVSLISQRTSFQGGPEVITQTVSQKALLQSTHFSPGWTESCMALPNYQTITSCHDNYFPCKFPDRMWGPKYRQSCSLRCSSQHLPVKLMKASSPRGLMCVYVLYSAKWYSNTSVCTNRTHLLK